MATVVVDCQAADGLALQSRSLRRGVPMKAGDLLNQVTVPSPCPVDWGVMRGDDRVRFCDSCGKHVYNFAAMTAVEAIDAIRAEGGELCGQITRRADGSLVTMDSSTAAEPRPSRWQFRIRTLMGVVAAVAAATRHRQSSRGPPAPSDGRPGRHARAGAAAARFVAWPDAGAAFGR